MKSNDPSIETIEQYIAAAAPRARPILKKILATVRKAAPTAAGRISYRMPAFFQEGVVIYFAAFKEHIGVYPPVRDATLRRETARFAGEKGNLRFPLNEPIPYALIGRIIKSRVRENLAKAAAKRKKKSSR